MKEFVVVVVALEDITFEAFVVLWLLEVCLTVVKVDAAVVCYWMTMTLEADTEEVAVVVVLVAE
jgi:hypothetical protein